jgi:hypothetical protein
LPPPEEAARLLRDGAPGAGASASASAAESTAPTMQAGDPPKAETPAHALQSFDDVIALIAAERIVELELALDRMKVAHFSPAGDLVFMPSDDLPRDLVRTLRPLLEEHTGIEWRIRAANEAAQVESLADRRRAERARALEELKRQPFVAEALRLFPDAEIAKVSQPSEESGGGDVAPFPTKPTPTPSPVRRQEPDR